MHKKKICELNRFTNKKKMIRYLKNCKWPQHPEILVMLVMGIVLQMIDGSPFSMNERWRIVWDIELPSEYFSNIAQKIIKTIITMIIIVRCSTTYAYVVSAMLVIFCLLKRSTPKLMLLWLLVAGLKSICMTFLEALAGVYICSAFGKIRKACIEFFISKALEIIFAAYLYGNVLSIYQEMETKEKEDANLLSKDILHPSFTRQRARSLIDESTLYKTACLNNFEFRDVPQIILQMLRTDEEMSQDSLIGPGMMLASVSNLGSFDDLKTSQSLGELGFMDLRTTQVVGLEEDENLPRLDKVLKFLKLTRSDIAIIKLNKATIENDIYTVDDEIWARVIASGTHINKPKQARTEVFIRDIPPPEEIAKNVNERKKSVKLNITFSNLFVEKPEDLQYEQDDEDSLTEEEENEEEICRLFMSNIKEGYLIHRRKCELKVIKGNQYEKLYKQEFMSRIGPEVFEKATNLPKVTSFIKTARNSVSLPEMKELQQTRRKSNSQEYPSGKIEYVSSSELKDVEEFKRQISPAKSFTGEITKTSTEGEIELDDEYQIEFKNLQTDSKELLEEDELVLKSYQESPSCQELSITEKKNSNSVASTDIIDCNNNDIKPCYKKRRIIIKRIGNRKADFDKQSFESSSSRNSNSENQLTSSRTQLDRKYTENLQGSSSSSSVNDSNNFDTIEKKHTGKSQAYFVAEMLDDPQRKLSFKNNNLTTKPCSEEKSKPWFYQSRILDLNFHVNNFESKNSDSINVKEKKIWKSNVLKTAACFLPKYYQTIESTSNNKTLLKKVLKSKYSRIFSKTFTEKEDKKLSDSNFLTPTVRRMNLEEDNNYRKINQTTAEPEVVVTINEPNKESENEKHSVLISENPSRTSNADFQSPESSNLFISSHSSIQDIEKNVDEETKIVVEGSFNKKKANSGTASTVMSKESSICSEESEESISLYYSKAADLASPLLDMKRFIYPDHIHYSYKHVNKKGFDVDMNGGLPLLVGQNPEVTSRLNIVNDSTSKSPELEIKRRPMDLSFATSNAFADWQSGYSNDVETKQNQLSDNTLELKKTSESLDDVSDGKKAKKIKLIKKINERNESRISNGITKSKSKPKTHGNDLKYVYSAKDYILIEKLLRMHLQFNKNDYSDFEKRTNERAPIQISSTQLHSNKGRQNSIKNPAIFLQKNKTTRNEKKKFETQEERTKDMFTRLAREAFLQNSGPYSSSGTKTKF